MAALQARIQGFLTEISKDNLDIAKLRALVFNGCPHENGIRSKCWKILLNYIPVAQDDSDTTVKKYRTQYSGFIDEMIIQPGKQKYHSNRCDVTLEDHPLNPNPSGQWSQYFKDNDMLLQIDKDCRRLYPGLGFFQRATEFPCLALTTVADGVETLRKRVEKSVLKAQDVNKSRVGVTVADKPSLQCKRPRTYSADEFVVLSEGEEAHWEVVERILFIYGKLNPGQSYVQGMNEIIGPIYYTFASDTDENNRRFAEADSFWCFTHLMSEIRDNFIKVLDDDRQSGIGMLMGRFDAMLKTKDVTLWCRLQEQQLLPQFYAFRWLTLLLSQEFPLPDVLRLWDSLFSDQKRFDFLLNVCCAMLILVREDILMNDFAQNMKLLQNYPGPNMDGMIDILMIINKAVELSDMR